MPRTIAIGDIHGCSTSLSAILEAIDPQPDDTIVTLGDVVDRGLDTRGVLDRLIALRKRCWLVPIRGNHDQMLLDELDEPGMSLGMWLNCGGLATLQSYGDVDNPRMLPPEHVAFLRGSRMVFESEAYFFVHANYRPEVSLSRQRPAILMWESLRDHVPGPHVSGKTAVVGHTSQKGGEILDLGHLMCIDTYCYGGGWLTALDVGSGQVWQADERGRMRR